MTQAASAPAAATTHRELKVQQIGSLVFVTPLDGATGEALPAAESPSLTVELSHGVVGLASFEAPAGMGTTSKPFNAWAILGCGKLLQGLAVAFVTSAELAGTLRGHPVFRATGFKVLGPEPTAHPDDARYVELLRKAVDPSSTGGGLYFSYGADLTLTTQAFNQLAPPPATKEGEEKSKPPALYSRADPKVWWNKSLCEPLLTSEMGAANLAPFVVPFICGSVGQAGPFEVSMGSSSSSSSSSSASASSSSSPPSPPDAQVTLTLIARRATSRPGVRHWRRGADAEGAVANFVETEQIVEIVRLSKTTAEDKSSNAPAKLSRDPRPSVASFVQVRGSIPLLWSQIPELKYKPPTRVAPAPASAAAFSKHAGALLERYGDVLALNLANAHGSEGLLGEAYASLASNERSKNPKSLRLVQFDFHAVCGATRYDRLEELWPSLAPDVKDSHSFFFAPGEGRLASPAARSQTGVVRTNCVDCLDRTNVVQGWLGRKALLEALSAVCGPLATATTTTSGSASTSTSLAEAAGSPALEQAFKTIWADRAQVWLHAHGQARARRARRRRLQESRALLPQQLPRRREAGRARLRDRRLLPRQGQEVSVCWGSAAEPGAAAADCRRGAGPGAERARRRRGRRRGRGRRGKEQRRKRKLEQRSHLGFRRSLRRRQEGRDALCCRRGPAPGREEEREESREQAQAAPRGGGSVVKKRGEGKRERKNEKERRVDF